MPQNPFRTYTEHEIETSMNTPANPVDLIPPIRPNGTAGKLEISKLLTLSTAHLTRETREKMDNPEFIDEVLPAIYPKTVLGTTYGWFVYTTRCAGQDEDEDNLENLPEDLKAAIDLANSLSCSVVCFDADADPVPNLKTYDD